MTIKMYMVQLITVMGSTGFPKYNCSTLTIVGINKKHKDKSEEFAINKSLVNFLSIALFSK